MKFSDLQIGIARQLRVSYDPIALVRIGGADIRCDSASEGIKGEAALLLKGEVVAYIMLDNIEKVI